MKSLSSLLPSIGTTTLLLLLVLLSLVTVVVVPTMMMAYAQTNNTNTTTLTPQERHQQLVEQHQRQQQMQEQPSPPPPAATTTTPPPTTTTTTIEPLPQLDERTDPRLVIIDRQTAATLASQDPFFARFEQVLATCAADSQEMWLSAGVTTTTQQCIDFMQQGYDRWCGLESYDALKCQYADELMRHFEQLQRTLGNLGLSDVPRSFLN